MLLYNYVTCETFKNFEFLLFSGYLIRILRILDEVVNGGFIMTNMTKGMVLLCLGIIPNAFSMYSNNNSSNFKRCGTAIKRETKKRKIQIKIQSGITVSCKECLKPISGTNELVVINELSKHWFLKHDKEKLEKFNDNFYAKECSYGVNKYYFAMCPFEGCFKIYRDYAISKVKNSFIGHVCCEHNPDTYNEIKEYVRMCIEENKKIDSSVDAKITR